MAELLGSELDVQAVRAQLKTQAKLRADTRKTLTATRPSYESPAFFSSELERYDFLFNVSFEQCLTLTPDDAAFMTRYEASEEYQVTGRRYEQLRRMYAATAQPLEATA